MRRIPSASIVTVSRATGGHGYDRDMQPVSYSRHRFPPAVIRYAVWLYVRFTLNFRNVEDMLAERGVEVSCETVRR